MNVLFEDDQMVVINKPAGWVVEGPSKEGRPSLAGSLETLTGQSLYPCHRLDRDTTGVLVFAKTKEALRQISRQFEVRRVRKAYFACVEGEWNPSWNRVETQVRRSSDGRMVNASAGKTAVTTFRRLASWSGKSLLEALPKTGRTHQIRLHCIYHHCPICGDKRYGSTILLPTPMALHASRLDLRHPGSGEPVQFVAPLPGYWKEVWLKGCPVDVKYYPL